MIAGVDGIANEGTHTSRTLGTEMPEITPDAPTPGSLQTEIEAAVFRRLVGHLRTRTDVQNIDVMNLAGFCRNCLSRWYEEEARERGVPVDRSRARELVYGMPYDEWKRLHQTPSTPEQQAAFESNREEETQT